MALNNRIEEIDILKGVAIILVVMGHALSWAFDINHLENYHPDALIARNVIYAFHMPLFFFLSGYVVDLGDKFWDKSHVYKIIGKRIVSLLVPALTYILINSLLLREFVYEWFLPALFLNTFLFSFLKFISSNLKFTLKAESIIFIAYFTIYALIPSSMEELKWDFKFFIFLYFGYLGEKINILSLLQKYPIVYTSSIIAFVISFYVTFHLGYQVKLGLITGMTGILIMLVLSTYIQHLPSCIKTKMLYIGKNTIVIYVLSNLFVPKYQIIGSFVNKCVIQLDSPELSLFLQ